MSNINEIILEGNLTRAAELSRWGNGTPYCKFTIASNKSYKDKDGNWIEYTNFIDCILIGPYAETSSKNLLKGRHITVVGSIRQNRWKDENGNNKSAIAIDVDKISYTPGSFQPKEQQQPAPANGAANYDQQIPEENYSSKDFNVPDDIPF